MKNKKLYGILISIAVLMFSLVGCGKPDILTLNVKKGQKYKITETVNEKIFMSTVDKNKTVNNSIIPSIEIDEESTTGYGYDITNVDNDGTVTVKVSYDFINAKVSCAGQTNEIDTRKDEYKNTPQGKVYAEMLKDGFTLKIDKDGKIKSATGINEMLDKALNSTKLDDTQKESLSKVLKENFGEEAIKGTFDSMINICPNKEIEKGTSWKTEEKVGYGIPMTISTDWKIEDIKDGIVSTDTNSQVNVDTKSAPLDILGVKMSYNIKGTQKGNVKINQDNGFMQNAEFKQKLSGTVEMIIPKSSTAAEQKILAPANIEGTIKYQTQKVK